VQLHPDDVARVEAHPVDPLVPSGQGPRHGGVVAAGVALEARQLTGQICLQQHQVTPHGLKGLQDPVVPAEVGVVVRRHHVATGGTQLPLGHGSLEPGVEREESLVRRRDCRSGADGIELLRHEQLVVVSSLLRQRPPSSSPELGAGDPSGRPEVLEGGLDGDWVEAETSGNSSGVGEAQYPHCVQRQRRGV